MLMSAASSRPPKVVVPLGVMAWAGSLMVSVAAGKVPVATVRVPLAVDEVRDAVAKTQGGRCCGAGHADGAIPGDAYPAAVGEGGAALRGPGVGVSHLAAGQQVDHERDAAAHGPEHEQCAVGGEADAGGGRAGAPGAVEGQGAVGVVADAGGGRAGAPGAVEGQGAVGVELDDQLSQAGIGSLDGAGEVQRPVRADGRAAASVGQAAPGGGEGPDQAAAWTEL